MQQTTLARLDRLVGRILLVNPPAQPDQRAGDDDAATQSAGRAFGFSLVFSGVRCILQYAILPFVLPLIGIAGDFATQITLLISIVAIIAMIFSLRRFWKINYKRKWQYFAIAVPAMLILISFVALDVVTLTGAA